jgi:hypothetical protein
MSGHVRRPVGGHPDKTLGLSGMSSWIVSINLKERRSSDGNHIG